MLSSADTIGLLHAFRCIICRANNLECNRAHTDDFDIRSASPQAFYLAQTAEYELMKLSNKVRFILAVISGSLKVSNRKKAEIEASMDGMGFDRVPPAGKASTSTILPAFCSMACQLMNLMLKKPNKVLKPILLCSHLALNTLA